MRRPIRRNLRRAREREFSQLGRNPFVAQERQFQGQAPQQSIFGQLLRQAQQQAAPVEQLQPLPLPPQMQPEIQPQQGLGLGIQQLLSGIQPQQAPMPSQAAMPSAIMPPQIPRGAPEPSMTPPIMPQLPPQAQGRPSMSAPPPAFERAVMPIATDDPAPKPISPIGTKPAGQMPVMRNPDQSITPVSRRPFDPGISPPYNPNLPGQTPPLVMPGQSIPSQPMPPQSGLEGNIFAQLIQNIPRYEIPEPLPQPLPPEIQPPVDETIPTGAARRRLGLGGLGQDMRWTASNMYDRPMFPGGATWQ